MNNIPKLKFKYLTLEETIIKEIEQKLLRYLDNAQMEMLHRTLKSCLDNVTFIMQEDSIQDIFEYSNMVQKEQHNTISLL